MKKKIPYLIITFENGDRFKVSADVVAEDRTKYFAKVDGFVKGSEAWENEFNYALNDPEELIDWIGNNMNWEDVETSAEKMLANKFDYAKGWDNAAITVIE